MRFTQIIGQDTATRALQRSIREDAVSHAYLFTGLEGVGKFTTALALAAALNCENPPEPGESCGECVQCRMIEAGRHPDVSSVAPSGGSEDTRIKQMQEMRRMAHYPPLRGRWKVNILERAETLNEDAGSCILKLLEEPPSFLVLIVVSSNPSAMLTTIRSRCQLVRFRAMSAESLENVLVERFQADSEQAKFLAAFSEGRPGRAISLLGNDDFFARRDALVALANRAIDEPVAGALKLSEELRKLAGGSVVPDVEEEAEADDEEEEPSQPSRGRTKLKKTDLIRALDTLVLWYRDLLSIKVRGPEAPVVNLDKAAELAERAAQCHLSYLRSSLKTLTDAKRYLDGNANVQLLSDVLAMRLMQ